MEKIKDPNQGFFERIKTAGSGKRNDHLQSVPRNNDTTLQLQQLNELRTCMFCDHHDYTFCNTNYIYRKVETVCDDCRKKIRKLIGK